MKLYHGTSERAARQIMETGLLPRSARSDRKGNWNHTILSHKDAVYLTNAYALYFGLAALDGDPKLAKLEDGVRAAVIEIDTALLDERALLPDEDCIEQVNRVRKSPDLPPGYHGWSMERRTRYWRKRLPAFSGTGSWKASLDAMGNCCHLGPIPASAITRVAFVELRKAKGACWMAMDPTISVLNYRLVGKKYRGLTKWLFGEPLGADAPTPLPYFGGLDLPDGLKASDFPTADFVLPDEAERAGIEILTLTERIAA